MAGAVAQHRVKKKRKGGKKPGGEQRPGQHKKGVNADPALP